jgi:hypothetical protein
MFCFLGSESCVLLPESLLNVVDDPGGKGAATLRPYFRMRAGGVGSGAGAPAPAARSAESCWGAACRARPVLSRSGASLQSCTAGEAGLPSAGRGIAAILRRSDHEALPPQPRAARNRVGARHAAPVQRSAAAGHRCNPAPQAKRVSPRRGAACRARTALSRSGASLQSCTAGEAGLPSAGRGMPRPYSAQRQRGIAAILRRRRSGSLRGGARHRAPVQCSAAAGHRCNPAPQAKRVSPRRGAASLQSCAAATTRRSRPSRAQRGIVLGRGMPRPYSAQRQRGIAAILRRRRSGSPLGGARHRAPVQRSAAAGHCCNPAPQRPRGAPAPAARSAESWWRSGNDAENLSQSLAAIGTL